MASLAAEALQSVDPVWSEVQRDAAAIVRAVTGLGSALGMETTAEGVETHDQFTRLQAEGCTEMQGYFFSEAAPAAEVPRLLRQFHSGEMQAV